MTERSPCKGRWHARSTNFVIVSHMMQLLHYATYYCNYVSKAFTSTGKCDFSLYMQD